MGFFTNVRERIKQTRVARWALSRQLRSWLVIAYLLVWTVVSGSWLLFFLFFPLYWQLYLKEDLAPKWW